MEKISYVCNSKNYTFRGECVYPAPGQSDFGKRIYRGNFVGANPCPSLIFPDREYMLVEINVDSGVSQPSGAPQARQYWDVAEFEGDHLRQVLSRSDSAQQLADELQKNSLPTNGRYLIIEPVYLPAAPYIQQMSPYEKLDLALQGCQALEELTSFHYPSRVLCHRDFKLANLMIEPMADFFRVRLIDFASLCRDGGDGTIHGAVSQGNTAPEVVYLEDTNFRVCDRTDVFALAGVLGELFGSCNPIFLWTQECWPTTTEDREACMDRLRAAYRNALNKYPYHPGDISWLERDLKGRVFRWKNTLPQDLMDRLIALFRQMIPIDPRDRISLEEVREVLTSLMRDMEKRNLAVRSCGGLYLRTTALVFDRRLLSRHRNSYLPAIKMIHDKALKQAKNAHCGGVKFTLLSYGHTDLVGKTSIERECSIGEAAGVEQVRSELQGISDADRGHYNLLPQALTAAGRALQGCFQADTTIHVFAPDDSVECPGKDDLSDAIEKLNRVQKFNLVLHSVKAEGDEHWYHYHDKLSPPPALWDTVDQDREAPGYAPPYVISKGPDAWFILRDGRKIYAGRKV